MTEYITEIYLAKSLYFFFIGMVDRSKCQSVFSCNM